MKAVLHTVPGSGTRFVSDILERVFQYRGIGHPEFIATENSGVYILVHSYGEGHAQHKKLDTVGDVPFVTALRNPVSSYLTRNAQSKRDGVGYFETPTQWAQRWSRLARVVEERGAFCFPVDADLDRVRLIERLGAHIRAWGRVGVKEEIVKAWQVVGSQGAVPEQTEYMQTGKVEGYDLAPLQDAAQWYNEQVEVLNA